MIELISIGILIFIAWMFYDNSQNRSTGRLVAPNLLSVDPDSPWGRTRSMAFARYGRKCRKCGKKKNLQVHHKTPLSAGGTNDLDNLTILCSWCHGKVHNKSMRFYDEGVDLSNYGQGAYRTPDSFLIRRIQRAIDNKNSLLIDYSDNTSKVTRRRIRPIELMKKDRRLYLKSYCELRSDDRTFRLDRIRVIDSRISEK